MTTNNSGSPGFTTPLAPPAPDSSAAAENFNAGAFAGDDIPSVDALSRLANDLFGGFSHGGFTHSAPTSSASSASSSSSIPRTLPDNVSRQAMRTTGSPSSSSTSKIPIPEEDRLRSLLGPRVSSKPTTAGTSLAPENTYYFLNPARPVAGEVQPTNLQANNIRPELLGDAGSAFRTFDVQAIRRDFPILEERVGGRQLIWLDNAATTHKPQSVIDRLTYFYQHENSNIHRAAHELAARSTDAYESARDKVARFVNASSSNEIIFTRGATEAINLVAQTWGRQNVNAGDEIVITWLEHHANIVPWQQLAAEKGAHLRVAPVDNFGQVRLDEYQKLLSPKTRLVAFPQVSNALGTVTPAKDIIAIARRYDARVLVDAAQSVAHSRTDVQALDCDWLVFSGHKVFAPTGIGVLYGREDLLNATLPWQGGGNMIQDVTFEKTTYQQAPMRYEAGTGNIADAVGLGAAIDYINRIGIENIARYEHDLLEYATRALARIPGLRLIGTAAERAGVISFVLDGFNTADVGRALGHEGIAVRSGHHCAQPILRRFGLEATVRPSIALYNTYAEIDTLVAAVDRIRNGLNAGWDNMHDPSGRLLELVCKLDAMAPVASLVDLAQAVEAAQLTLADVQDYVEENPRNYNRALVALREHYELLVMTWLPGQSSVPHDHAGSICAMQVVQGEASEGSYRVAPDGYVDLDYETRIRAGEVTSGQDAGVHTVLNPISHGELLVTVHAYAPPLKDFRRYVPRPQSPATRRDIFPAGDRPTVVVVGGGFSGSMTAAQLLRKARAAKLPLRVVVVERRGAVGEGLAYGTREPNHLLNVPAGRMSAWPDSPDDFLRWVSKRRPTVRPGEFLPRQWYGEYVRETLLTEAEEPGSPAEFSVLLDEVRRVARRPDGGWLVHLARGASLRADAVVLAIGHRPPDDPFGSRWTGPRTRLMADPWRPFAMNAIRPDESVIVIGAGLTGVDAVLSLAHPSRTAPITILSRRGLLPQAHSQLPLTAVDLKPLVTELLASPGGLRILELCRRLRRMVRELAEQGVDWRSVVDGIRPHTAALWRALSAAERRRFLAHLRPFWEVHRHRMALTIAERFGDMRDYDQVCVVAGRVRSAVGSDNRVQLLVDGRGEDGLMKLDADWVVNCTGPAPANCAASNPAIGSLLVDGWLRPDELGLGLDTVLDGHAIDRRGEEVADLFIIGTLRKPAVWESTAVPELRSQAATVAERLIDTLKHGKK